jgi:oligopeptide/dipeptide ABC transporter ATP-binding protein
MSNTIGVMYHGAVMELASRKRLFSRPQHPCTHALLASIPSAEPLADRERAEEHVIIREEVVSGQDVVGCRFHPRCPLGARDLCRTVEPGLDPVAPGHRVACHYPQSAESLKREALAATTA